MSLVYLYDGSFDGLLSAVFAAYARKEEPAMICEEENAQIGLGGQMVLIEMEEEKSARVQKGLMQKLGSPFCQKIWTAYLASDLDKATVIYRYIRRGLEVGRRVYSDLAHPDVLAMDKICRRVNREAHALREFIRFAQVEGGIYYAKITPEHEVLSLIMPHFADRYAVQPFLIHDCTHAVAGVYNLREWVLVDADELSVPDITYDELGYQRMWKRFYETAAIEERKNLRCRRNFMPLKYWQNMTEHSFIETPKTARIDREHSTPKEHLQIPSPEA